MHFINALGFAHAQVQAVNLLDPKSLISAFGTLGILFVLFAETGLLVGIFLPGDSLLFTAGLFCTTSSQATIRLSLPWVLLAACIGAVAGGQTGFLIGRSAGPAFIDRVDRPRLHRGVVRTEEFFARYGHGKAVVLARFVPLVRTLINPLAGVIRVPVRTFSMWNVVGGVLWAVSVTMAGYLLGSSIKNIDHYLLPIIAVIILLSLIPVVMELRRSRATVSPGRSTVG
jgi:membrane-associated protein